MEKKERYDFGIKYKILKLNNKRFFLIPVEVVEGYEINGKFYCGDIYQSLDSATNFDELDYLIDSVFNSSYLCNIYDYDDATFVKEYFFTEEENFIILVEKREDENIKRKINISNLVKTNKREEYKIQEEKPAVILNDDSLNMLLGIEEIETLKAELKRYQNSLAKFKEHNEKQDLTEIVVENGHIKSFETSLPIKIKSQEIINSSVDKNKVDKQAVSLAGLEKYIKERVFGHDDEIRIIAKTLIMNYRAGNKYDIEPILIVGSTGTGKTETIKAASDYLDMPFLLVNTANLVPRGIQGTSIENCLYSLLALCNYDLEKAQRSLIFFDEFDKIGKSKLDIKEAVKDIMLDFLDGSNFLINNDSWSESYNFNTKMLNKVYAGAFQVLFDRKLPLGFGDVTMRECFNPTKIYEEEYFGKELVTRIPHIFVYYPLDKETKKRVILESKISAFRSKVIRYEEEFHTKLVATDSYIDALIAKIDENDKSMRDLNTLILSSLNFVECSLLENEGHTKEVILTDETVENPHKFILK